MIDNNENLLEIIKTNYSNILENLKQSALKSGRKIDSIKIMAVTKTKPLEYAEAAYSAGIRIFGENRIAELEEKYKYFHNDTQIHFIGHLQRNKAKTASQYADFVDSIDKYDTAEALNRHCSFLNKKINILLEFNTSEEITKSGFTDESSFFQTIDKIRYLENIKIRGLMTIAPFTDNLKAVRDSFRTLAKMFEKMKVRHPDLEADILSMGMSSDYQIAVEEGSTLIRIGTTLFGSRNN